MNFSRTKIERTPISIFIVQEWSWLFKGKEKNGNEPSVDPRLQAACARQPSSVVLNAPLAHR